MQASSWDQVLGEVAELSRKHTREVTIVAVSKGQSAEKIRHLCELKNPPTFFAESYLAEALEKQKQFNLPKQAQWHFIGRLQSRKIAEIVQNFSCLHSVSRIKEIEGLLETPEAKPTFFLQVNTSGEVQKNGFLPAELASAIAFCNDNGLKDRLLGLMTLPAPLTDVSEVQLRREFSSLRELRDRLCPEKLLNMGSSSDYKIAISEGSDWIRLGTVIFGERS